MNEIKTSTKNKNPILPIFLTIFIDLLGVGLIIPVLAPLILKNETGVFGMGIDYSTRTVIFGFLLAAFSISQFIANPIIGSLSDMFGRRKVLIFSVFATVLGYIVLTMGIYLNSIILIFLGRIIPGLASGNITIAYSSLADVSDETTKTKNFGLIGMAFGLGFIIGPFAGGELANHNLVSWFGYTTPFIAAGILSVVNLIFVYTSFPETLKKRRHTKISILAGAKNINKAFSYTSLRSMFIVVFINALGFSFFTQFFIVLLIGKFNFQQQDIGIFFGYLGLCVVISQGWLLRIIAKRLKPEKIVLFSLPILFIALSAMVFPDKAFYLFMIIPFMSIGQSFSNSAMTAVVSNLGGATIQGEILGITLSMNALAQAIPALIGGVLVASNYYIPIFFAAGCAFLGWFLFVIFYRMKHHEQFILEEEPVS